MKTNKPNRTGNAKKGTIAIPWTHSPVASKLEVALLSNPSPTSSLRPLSRLRVAHSSNWDPHGLPKQRSIESRKKRCKISQLLKPLSTTPGHFSDRTFFVTLAMTRFSSLLSVINIDSLIVCLQVTLLSSILLLCSGKLPLRLRVKSGVCNESYTTKKEEWT